MNEAASLDGFLVVVARDDAPDDPISQCFTRSGAQVVGLPLMRKERLLPCHDLDHALDALDTFDCIAFASPAAVDFFAERCAELEIPLRDIVHGLCIAAVGSQTASVLHKHGLHVTVVGERGGAALGEQLNSLRADRHGGADIQKPWRVLLPRAVDGREELQRVLEYAGAQVSVVDVYGSRILPDAELRCWEAMRRVALHRGPRALVLTSPKRVEALAAFWSQADHDDVSELTASASATSRLWPHRSDLMWIAIGETTGEAMRTHGFTPVRIAAQPTPEAMVAAVGGR